MTGKKRPTVKATVRIDKKIYDYAIQCPGGFAKFVRDAVESYKANRHESTFRDIQEAISKEVIALSLWKEKGHPDGLKWSRKYEEMLLFYERCLEVLDNSPLGK